MATEGTPNEGLDYAAALVYTSGLTLIAYTNAADSLDEESVYADLVQPTESNGYAPIVLDGDWSFSSGTVTYTKSGLNPSWLATGAWSDTVYGVAMVDTVAEKILHFRDCSSPFVAANLKRLEIDIVNLVT